MMAFARNVPIRVTDPMPVPPTGPVRLIDGRGRERRAQARVDGGSLVLYDLPGDRLDHGTLVIDEQGHAASVRLGRDGYQLFPFERNQPTVLWARPPTGQQLTVSALRQLLDGLPDGMLVEAYFDCGQRADVDTVAIDRGVLCIGEG